MPQPLHILPATPDDLTPAFTLLRACIDHMNANNIRQWDDIYPNRETLERDLSSQSLYLAKENTTLRGLIVLDANQPPEYAPIPWLHQGSPILIIHRLAVDPASQNQGIAAQLMEFAEDFARTHRFAAIRLDAFVYNPAALRLYIRRNYRLAGTVHFRKGPFHVFERPVTPNP